ncbi:hypothetical protein GCM10028796_21520 [Ramlibacter monticola]|uniref:Uncharacterized protein n=1 Tax=Ramlibacter monticola TaxID=1926872 RepID=A0A937CU77_9BURK|nr:hypothetical protein [Ramlibacter monticola]MBL0392403.1 hypothetical protein [Ramlibacter monticola]
MTRRSTLHADEKLVLAQARRLGLPIAAAMLGRALKQQRLPGGTFAEEVEDQDEDLALVHGDVRADHAVQEQRQLTPVAGVGYVTKAHRA